MSNPKWLHVNDSIALNNPLLPDIFSLPDTKIKFFPNPKIKRILILAIVHPVFKYLWTAYLDTVFEIGWNNSKTQISAFHTWGDMAKNIKMFAAEIDRPISIEQINWPNLSY